ncbi:hypothetical protein EJB05_40479 [Eragrostis curvula]|uniref:Uncharacterized protein n=1 Tax=Eragrostis curvula TaxID=38414 RepID=A0A5J9TPU4_9POAL|nr:hypothetical protein EJB05_40479 [Eragrostis curvula]
MAYFYVPSRVSTPRQRPQRQAQAPLGGPWRSGDRGGDSMEWIRALVECCYIYWHPLAEGRITSTMRCSRGRTMRVIKIIENHDSKLKTEVPKYEIDPNQLDFINNKVHISESNRENVQIKPSGIEGDDETNLIAIAAAESHMRQYVQVLSSLASFEILQVVFVRTYMKQMKLTPYKALKRSLSSKFANLCLSAEKRRSHSSGFKSSAR